MLTKTKTAVEWVKTGLIVLLTASAFLLGWRTGLFNDFFGSIPLFGSVAELMRGPSGSGMAGSGSFKEAAKPLTIVITNEEGKHYGVKYDTDARNAAYDRTSSIMGEALGSAAVSSEISEAEWREALSGPNVYFEYISPVRFPILSAWLIGVRMTEITHDFPVRRVCIAFSDDKSRIYYQDNDSGAFYSADTAASSGKAQELGIYTPNGTFFAFELGLEVALNAPYMLIMPDSEHPDVRAVVPGSPEELLNMTLSALGHSNEQYITQPESTGGLRRVGTQFNISVDMNGSITYRRIDLPAHDNEQPLPTACEVIEIARSVVADTIGMDCGSAEVFSDLLQTGEGDSCSVYFGYYIAGGRVYLPRDNHAARVTVISGVVTDVELCFRSFSYTGDYTVLLPERQALAAAGGEFMLCYSDTGADILQPTWVLH